MSTIDFPWKSHHRLTAPQYQTYFNQYVADGYNLVNLSGYNLNGRDTYAAIWYKNNGPLFIAQHRMSTRQYQDKFAQYLAEGYRLVSVSGYENEGVANYAAFWNKENGPASISHHGMTSKQYQSYFDKYINAGYVLGHLVGYNINGLELYAATWWAQENSTFIAKHGMNSDQFQDYLDELRTKGFRPTNISGYRYNGEARFTAIWCLDPGADWLSCHNLTLEQYQDVFDEYILAGYRLKSINGYVIKNIDYYTAIWEKPSGFGTLSQNASFAVR